MGERITLPPTAHHYLKNVLRRQTGDKIRLFNANSGEGAAQIITLDKKSAVVEITALLRPVPAPSRRRHLIFSPLKAARQDMLIEKAVELGATDFHPVLTDHADVRALNPERTHAQIVEAVEQCERLDLPTLHPLKKLPVLLHDWDENRPILAGIERAPGAQPLGNCTTLITNAAALAMLIGPAGGWSENEKEMLIAHRAITPVSLGETILRAETASLAMLAFVHFLQNQPEK